MNLPSIDTDRFHEEWIGTIGPVWVCFSCRQGFGTREDYVRIEIEVRE